MRLVELKMKQKTAYHWAAGNYCWHTGKIYPLTADPMQVLNTHRPNGVTHNVRSFTIPEGEGGSPIPFEVSYIPQVPSPVTRDVLCAVQTRKGYKASDEEGFEWVARRIPLNQISGEWSAYETVYKERQEYIESTRRAHDEAIAKHNEEADRIRKVLGLTKMQDWYRESPASKPSSIEVALSELEPVVKFLKEHGYKVPDIGYHGDARGQS